MVFLTWRLTDSTAPWTTLYGRPYLWAMESTALGNPLADYWFWWERLLPSPERHSALRRSMDLGLPGRALIAAEREHKFPGEDLPARAQ